MAKFDVAAVVTGFRNVDIMNKWVCANLFEITLLNRPMRPEFHDFLEEKGVIQDNFDTEDYMFILFKMIAMQHFAMTVGDVPENIEEFNTDDYNDSR